MKYKNIDELAKSHYPSDADIEIWALSDFVNTYADIVRKNELLSDLFRCKIHSISDLYNASIDDLKQIKSIGPKKLKTIIDLKDFITCLIEES